MVVTYGAFYGWKRKMSDVLTAVFLIYMCKMYNLFA